MKNNSIFPLILQDANSKKVLSIVYATEATIKKMKHTGVTWRYSRSKKRAVMKGEESGNTQRVTALYKDCDGDAFLALVRPRGPACGEGYETCFYRTLNGRKLSKRKFDPKRVYSKTRFLDELYEIAAERLKRKPRDSYTAKIAKKKEKIIGKLCEEASELANEKNDALKIKEAADLLYFATVLLAKTGVSPSEACAELEKRRKEKTKN